MVCSIDHLLVRNIRLRTRYEGMMALYHEICLPGRVSYPLRRVSCPLGRHRCKSISGISRIEMVTKDYEIWYVIFNFELDCTHLPCIIYLVPSSLSHDSDGGNIYTNFDQIRWCVSVHTFNHRMSSQTPRDGSNQLIGWEGFFKHFNGLKELIFYS